MPTRETWAGWINTYFPPSAFKIDPDTWSEEPVPEWTGPVDDQELLDKMLATTSAKSSIGLSVTPRQLWDADEVALGNVFPHPARAFDWSTADAALMSHLAFWTGKDCARMQRLFELSALADRDKWRDREPYQVSTVLFAASACQAVYNVSKKKKHDIIIPGVDGVPEATPYGTEAVNGIRPGLQYLTAVDQAEHFKGCVYISSEDRVLIPNGMLLKQGPFKVVYGGYVFALDDGSVGKATKNAWEIFTESQAIKFPRADGTCFRPDTPPGALIDDNGRTLVNTYVPINTPSMAGDPAPFIDLLERILPVERDRSILLSYMAACVQYPGVKFQWCPLLQGAPGNGKTFIWRALVQAIGRQYIHLPESKDISNKFNSWLGGKLLIIMDEVCNQANQLDKMETLKWMIANEIVPSQGKGTDQTTGDNVANFMLFSNYKDAIQKTQEDRRFSVFYAAQQVLADFARDGLDGSYFPKLWDWARADGWAIITNYLRTYAIAAEFNPAGGCNRAPDTSSTREALTESRTFVEQAIIEAIESDVVGFRGGWVGSLALDNFLKDNRINLAYNTRRNVLNRLGYSYHPGLPGGRATRSVLVEGGKPRLYLARGHIALNVADPAEVVRMYSEAQGYEIPAGTSIMPGQTLAQQ
jgi:hypothetical protein